MSKLIVYLAGPMAGLTVRECRAWRIVAAKKLVEAGFTVLDPTRELDHLDPDTIVTAFDEERRGVFSRDKFDSTRADILIINLLRAKYSSIGTLMEMAWSHLAGKFLSVAIEDEGNPHDHTFTRGVTSVKRPTIEEAVDYVIETFS